MLEQGDAFPAASILQRADPAETRSHTQPTPFKETSGHKMAQVSPPTLHSGVRCAAGVLREEHAAE
jgi:hypothetical protein